MTFEIILFAGAAALGLIMGIVLLREIKQSFDMGPAYVRLGLTSILSASGSALYSPYLAEEKIAHKEIDKLVIQKLEQSEKQSKKK